MTAQHGEGMPAMTPLTKDDLVRGFRALGIAPGAMLMVHSSLKSFVCTADGPRTVVDALMETVTEDGTLLLPSFNHCTPFEPGGPGYYSPLETPTTNGAIPDCFWRVPGVLRSLDPTHAFAAWGKRARELLTGHHRTITLGPDSPLGRLWRAGGRCLLIGVDYRPNTFKHVVEVTEKAPCLGVRTEAYPVKLAGGRKVLARGWSWRERNCPISEPAAYARAEMERRGLHATGSVGPAQCILFRLDDFYGVHSEMLAKGVDGHPPCRSCPIRPRKCGFTVESDWDFDRSRPKPDSQAWTYEDPF